MYRDETKVIHIGDRVIGGGNPVLIQSMTNVPTEDVEACVAQILRLEAAGCEISVVPYRMKRRPRHLQRLRSAFIFRLWQIFILIIKWRLQLWKTVRIKSVSIREI